MIHLGVTETIGYVLMLGLLPLGANVLIQILEKPIRQLQSLQAH